MTAYFNNCTMLQVIEKQQHLVGFQLSRGLELQNTMAVSTSFQIPDLTVLWKISRYHTHYHHRWPACDKICGLEPAYKKLYLLCNLVFLQKKLPRIDLHVHHIVKIQTTSVIFPQSLMWC